MLSTENSYEHVKLIAETEADGLKAAGICIYKE